MPIHRPEEDRLDLSQHELRHLPWADEELLANYRANQPTEAQLARVDALQVTPTEYLANSQLVVRALENALAKLLGSWMTAVAETVDERTAIKIGQAAGRAHSAHYLRTFLSGHADRGESSAKLMAELQDIGHSMRGPRHTTALFARYDDRMVEIVRTDDSMGSYSPDKLKKRSPVDLAFLEGMVEGYQSADPALQRVDEIIRRGPNGALEIVHRFWYGSPD